MTGPREDSRALMLSEIEHIKERMRNGNPTAKQLAKELGVNPLTVSRTMKVLAWLDRELTPKLEEESRGSSE